MNNNEDEDGNGASSISTSSTSMEIPTGQVLTTDNKIEGENISKKMKRDESSPLKEVEVEAGPSQSQESIIVKETLVDDVLWDESLIIGMEVEVGPSQEEEESSVEEAWIDNLPPEMLMEILKYVDTPSLFDCRLVNRHWSAISTGILRQRPYTFTNFEYCDGSFLWSKFRFSQDQKRSLSDFVTCIKNSKDSPFAQFYFLISDENTNPVNFFKEEEFKEFTSYLTSSNQRIKSLALNFCSLDDVKMFQMVTRELRDFLVNKILQPEELALDFEISAKVPRQTKLFPTSKQTKIGGKINVVKVPVQLPHLKALELHLPMALSYTEMFKDLLNAAVNLKSIFMVSYNPGDFQFLHSLGKLHLLKEIIIEINRDLFSATESDKNSTPLPLPKLDSFYLRMNTADIESDSIVWSDAANFLGKLFESSKDTLTELSTRPFGFFPGLQLPIFTKLRKLNLSQCSRFSRQMFHIGTRSRDVFPAVSDLDFNIGAWESAFPQEDSIPVLPNVKTLRMDDCECQPNAISILASMCPNLRKFEIFKYDFTLELDFLLIFRAIWTHMQQLESLEFDVDLDSSVNNSTALDSCFTGISLENCQHLCKVMEAKETLENIGASVDIPESKLQAVAVREYSSILDMKDLKTLTIHPYSGRRLLKRMEFFTKLTWISEEFAFKFLPHLKPKPEKED